MLLGYSARRIFAAIPVLFFVAISTFSLMYLVPGDAARMILGDTATAEQVARLRHQLGLDEPFTIRFASWLTDALHGDLGSSVFLAQPVSTVIGQRAVVTMTLAVAAELVAVALGIGLGLYMATTKSKRRDDLLSVVSVAGIAVPGFVVAILLIAVFAVLLRWLPATGFVPPWEDPLRSVATLALPVISLALHQAALIARVMRGSMIEVMEADYMLAVTSRGINKSRRLLVHALPNALGPTISVIGVGFGSLVSGVVVIESVFNIPGLGRLIIQAVNTRDIVLLQGVVLTTAVLYILVNLMTDIVQAWVNPRLKLD